MASAPGLSLEEALTLLADVIRPVHRLCALQLTVVSGKEPSILLRLQIEEDQSVKVLYRMPSTDPHYPTKVTLPTTSPLSPAFNGSLSPGPSSSLPLVLPPPPNTSTSEMEAVSASSRVPADSAIQLTAASSSSSHLPPPASSTVSPTPTSDTAALTPLQTSTAPPKLPVSDPVVDPVSDRLTGREPLAEGADEHPLGGDEDGVLMANGSETSPSSSSSSSPSPLIAPTRVPLARNAKRTAAIALTMAVDADDDPKKKPNKKAKTSAAAAASAAELAAREEAEAESRAKRKSVLIGKLKAGYDAHALIRVQGSIESIVKSFHDNVGQLTSAKGKAVGRGRGEALDQSRSIKGAVNACSEAANSLGQTGIAAAMLAYWLRAELLHDCLVQWQKQKKKSATDTAQHISSGSPQSSAAAGEHDEKGADGGLSGPMAELKECIGFKTQADRAGLRSLRKLLTEDVAGVGRVSVGAEMDFHPALFADISWKMWKTLLASSEAALLSELMNEFAEHIHQGKDWKERQWVEEVDVGDDRKDVNAKRAIRHNELQPKKVTTILRTCNHVGVEHCPTPLEKAFTYEGYLLRDHSRLYNPSCHDWLRFIHHHPPHKANCEYKTDGGVWQKKDIAKGEVLTRDFGLEYCVAQLTGLGFDKWEAQESFSTRWRSVFVSMHKKVVDYNPLQHEVQPRHAPDSPEDMQSMVDLIKGHLRRLEEEEIAPQAEERKREESLSSDIVDFCLRRARNVFKEAAMDASSTIWKEQGHSILFLYAMAASLLQPLPDDVSQMVDAYIERNREERTQSNADEVKESLGEDADSSREDEGTETVEAVEDNNLLFIQRWLLSSDPPPSPSPSALVSGQWQGRRKLSVLIEGEKWQEATNYICDVWLRLMVTSSPRLPALLVCVSEHLEEQLVSGQEHVQFHRERTWEVMDKSGKRLYFLTHLFYVGTRYFTRPLCLRLSDAAFASVLAIFERLLQRQRFGTTLLNDKVAANLELIVEFATCLTCIPEQLREQVTPRLDELRKELLQKRWRKRPLGYLVVPPAKRQQEEDDREDDADYAPDCLYGLKYRRHTDYHLHLLIAHFLLVWPPRTSAHDEVQDSVTAEPYDQGGKEERKMDVVEEAEEGEAQMEHEGDTEADSYMTAPDPHSSSSSSDSSSSRGNSGRRRTNRVYTHIQHTHL